MVTVSSLTKSSSHSCQPDLNSFFWQAQAGSEGLYNKLRRLNGSVYFSFICCNMRKTVARFHGIVRQKWSGISSFNHFRSLFKRAFGITILTKQLPGLFCHFRHHPFMLPGALQTAWDLNSLFTSKALDNNAAVSCFFPLHL